MVLIMIGFHSRRSNPFTNIIPIFSPEEVESLEQIRYQEILELHLSLVCREKSSAPSRID